MEDALILGGHKFTSRFILGSGKYSLELIKAAVENAGAEILTLALRRVNDGGMAIFWITSLKALRFCPTPAAHAPRRKLCALPAWHARYAAVIL